MKSNLLVFFLLLFVGVPAVFAAGKRLTYRGIQYDVYTVDPRDKGFQLVWKDNQGNRFGSFRRLRRYFDARDKKLLFATNAGIFEVGYVPLGLHVEKKKKLVALNRNRGRGNFYVRPNGVFVKHQSRFSILPTVKADNKQYDYATQSGPLLVYNNRINRVFRSKSDSLYIRNGVGVNRRGQAVFVISNSPVNFYTLARLFKHKLRCKHALYLDGSISAMYLPEVGRYELGGDFAGIITVVEDKR